MSENVVINNTTYNGVDSLALIRADGTVVTFYPDAVRYNAQALTEAQKAQARLNIGVGSVDEVAAEVLARLGTPVFGTVDEENNIILTGELADGTYTIKYEDAEGEQTVIGTLSHVPAPTYTNVLPLAIDKSGAVYNGTGYKVGARIGSSGTEGTVSNPNATNPIFLTGYIKVPAGATIRMKNCFIDTNGVNGTLDNTADAAYYGHDSGLYGCMIYTVLSQGNKDEGTTNYTWATFANFSHLASKPTVDSNGYITEFTLNTTTEKYIRMHLGGDPTTAIITINEPITD